MTWILSEDRVGVDMSVCSDTLSASLNDRGLMVKGYDYDGIVSDNVPGNHHPSSVDFILRKDESLYFIEFKGGNIANKDIISSLKMKAVDSIHIFDSFIPKDLFEGIREYHLIIVARYVFFGLSTVEKKVSVESSLSRFEASDNHGDRLYYDGVRVMDVDAFVEFLTSLGFESSDELIS